MPTYAHLDPLTETSLQLLPSFHLPLRHWLTNRPASYKGLPAHLKANAVITRKPMETSPEIRAVILAVGPVLRKSRVVSRLPNAIQSPRSRMQSKKLVVITLTCYSQSFVANVGIRSESRHESVNEPYKPCVKLSKKWPSITCSISP